MKFITPAAILAVALAATGAASATTIGLPGSGSISSTYDTFPSASFTAASPNTTAAAFNSTLSFTSTGGILLGSGDRIYSGGNATTIDIAGSAVSALTDLQLVLKFTSPSVGSAAAFYTATLGGVSATAQFVGTSTEGANTFNVYQWTWSGLNIAAGSNFQILANGGADHVSLDAIQVNSVPEASTALVGALAAGGLLIRRRRN